MWRWLRRLAAKDPAPLTGAPAVRRIKTYSAESGYVYEYYYQGHRRARRPGAPGVEYVFNVSADRRTFAPVTVFLPDESVESWEEQHDEELTSTERYAVVKLALFQAFNERTNPAQMRHEVRIRLADISEILSRLDYE